MLCVECGKELGEGQKFCPYCGAQQGGGEAREAKAAGQLAAPAPEHKAEEVVVPSVTFPWKIFLSAFIAVAIVVAVVLVIVLVVFAQETPADVAAKAFHSVQNRNPAQYLSLIDPKQDKRLKAELGPQYLEVVKQYLIDDTVDNPQFNGFKYSTQIKGDNATVKVTKGTFTYNDISGKKVSEDAAKDSGLTVELVKKNGNWYLSHDLQIPLAGTFRADRQRTGVFLSNGPASIKTKKWEFKADGMVDTSPAVSGGVAFFGSQKGTFYAVDVNTGAQKWKRTSMSSFFSSATVVGEHVYVGCGDKVFRCFNARTGEIEWGSTMEDAIDSSPLVIQGLVYFGDGKGVVHALNVDDGKEVWSFTAGAAVVSSPALYKGVLYFGSWDGNLYALDALSGKKKWAFKTGDKIQATPAVAEGVVYVGSWDKNFYAVDATSGKEMWKFQTGDAIDSSAAVAGDLVYFGGHDNKFYALDQGTGKEKWSFAQGAFSSPAVASDTVYFGGINGTAYALDAATGKQKSSFKTGDMIASSPSVANGVILIGSSDTKLYALH